MPKDLRRGVATLLAAALFWAAPGLGAHEACAQVLRGVPGAPVSGLALPVGASAPGGVGQAPLSAPLGSLQGAPLESLPTLSLEARKALRPSQAVQPLKNAFAPLSAAPESEGAATPEASDAGPVAPGQGGYLSDSSAKGKTVLMIGTKPSRPFILQEAVKTAQQLGLELYLVDTPENRAHSKKLIPDSHFIAAPLDDRDEASVAKTAEAVAAHPAAQKAQVVAGFLSSYAKVAAQITDRLRASGIPGSAVAAADDKALGRKVLNQDPVLAVPYAVLNSPEEARASFKKLGGGKFIMKTIRGENSRFLAVNLDSPEAVEKAYREMDAAVKAYAARPEAKSTTFSTHPGILLERMLEKLPGTDETSVEVVMQDGKPVIAMVSDTLNIGFKGELAAGSMTFPSAQPKDVHAAFIDVTSRALNALGIRNGSARVDMILTKDGPRVVEVNPFMGAVAIYTAVKSLTGVSLVEQGLRALLGLKVDAGHAPNGVIDYRFLASPVNGKVESVSGLDEVKKSPGVKFARLFVDKGGTVSAPGKSSYEEYGEIIVKGKDLADAMAKGQEAMKKLRLIVRREDGSLTEFSGDYAQPPAPGVLPADPAAAKGPGLFSKVVFGFLSTFVLVQTVVESTSLAVSQLTEPLSQGFWGLTALASSSYLAYAAGSFLGGRWVDRFGIGPSYRVVLAARTLIWLGIAGAFWTLGSVPLSLLVPLFSLDYFVHSVGRVAEHKVQVTWFGNNPTDSSRFGSFRDFVEYATVFIASATGLAVSAWGFGAVLYPAPLAFGAAALIGLFIALPGKPAEQSAKVQWSAGFKSVLSNKTVLRPLLGYMLVNSFLYMMYYVVATAFGAYAAGGNAAHAAAISGALTGLYGVGALLGALSMDRVAARIDKDTESLPEADRAAARRELYEKSAARSLRWAAPALLGSWLLFSRTPLFTFGWPFYAVSPALILIGFTAQKALVHLDTILKDRIRRSDPGLEGSAIGATRALTYLSYVAGFILWGGAFAVFGTGAFLIFGAFYTLAAAAYLALAKGLTKK